MTMPSPRGRLEAQRYEERFHGLVRLLARVQSRAALFHDLELQRAYTLWRRQQQQNLLIAQRMQRMK